VLSRAGAPGSRPPLRLPPPHPCARRARIPMSRRPAGGGARAAAKAWAGRFEAPTARLVEEFTTALPVDRLLSPYHIGGSRGHVKALVRAKLLTPREGRRLDAGLRRVLAELDGGHFRFRRSDEDIHMAIQRRLNDRIGPP